MTIDPTVAFIGAIAAPFGARWWVAWTVELRLRGILYGANLEPRRLRSDYPSPNDSMRAVIIFLVVMGVSWPVGAIATNLLPSAVPLAAFFVSAIVSVGWALLRIRADDRRTREVLAARLVPRGSGDRVAR